MDVSARTTVPVDLPARPQEKSAVRLEESDRQELLDQIHMLEGQLAKLAARVEASDSSSANARASAPAIAKTPQMIAQAAPPAQQMPQMPMGAQTAAPAGTTAQEAAPKTVEERLDENDKRLSDLESSTVLSEPISRTKKIEVWVDQNSNEYDHQVPGAKKVLTYQRERVYRRENINEKIGEALSEQEEKSVQVGVSGAIMPQGVVQTQGPGTQAAGRAYDLASADLFFSARVAQNTHFFADLVGLTGPTPDGTPPGSEIPALTLLNSYTARLVRQNEVNVREAWLRTEIFSQKLAIVAGRLDMANYFDRNAAANDETSQFLSDALVNNPVLGLTTNGAGVALVYDPKKTVNFKIGFQHNNVDATSLSASILSLAEIGYVMKPFSLPAGNYRFWARTDSSTGRQRNGIGVSFDQKLTDALTLFGRFGQGYVLNEVEKLSGNMRFFSGGLELRKHFIFFPGDAWGIGFAQTKFMSGAARENLAEVYYNFQLTERLRLSPRVQYVREERAGAATIGYLVPGLRLQATF